MLRANLESGLCRLRLVGPSKDEMMVNRRGHELNRAGQDSLLEQMEAPWVNTINDIVRQNIPVDSSNFSHLQNPVLIM